MSIESTREFRAERMVAIREQEKIRAESHTFQINQKLLGKEQVFVRSQKEFKIILEKAQLPKKNMNFLHCPKLERAQRMNTSLKMLRNQEIQAKLSSEINDLKMVQSNALTTLKQLENRLEKTQEYSTALKTSKQCRDSSESDEELQELSVLQQCSTELSSRSSNSFDFQIGIQWSNVDKHVSSDPMQHVTGTFHDTQISSPCLYTMRVENSSVGDYNIQYVHGASQTLALSSEGQAEKKLLKDTEDNLKGKLKKIGVLLKGEEGNE